MTTMNDDFHWANLDQSEKEKLRAAMRAKLTQPVGASSRGAGVDLPELNAIHLVMAANPNTPAPILHELAWSSHTGVLERVAEHPRAHPATLSLLARHEHADVRAAVAENICIPPDLLMELAADDHPDVRYRIAENHNTPPAILQKLYDDDNPYVACRAQKTLARLESESRVGSVMPPNAHGFADTPVNQS